MHINPHHLHDYTADELRAMFANHPVEEIDSLVQGARPPAFRAATLIAQGIDIHNPETEPTQRSGVSAATRMALHYAKQLRDPAKLLQTIARVVRNKSVPHTTTLMFEKNR